MRKIATFTLGLCCLLGFVFATGSTVGINNIKHTKTDSTVNLSWDVTSGNSQADMFLWSQDEKIFKFISTVDVYNKGISLQITEDGPYTVRFIPSGGGNDIRYSFVVSGTNSITPAGEQKTKTITAVPKTGTTSNILLILAISVLLYILYWYKKMAKR